MKIVSCAAHAVHMGVVVCILLHPPPCLRIPNTHCLVGRGRGQHRSIHRVIHLQDGAFVTLQHCRVFAFPVDVPEDCKRRCETGSARGGSQKSWVRAASRGDTKKGRHAQICLSRPAVASWFPVGANRSDITPACETKNLGQLRRRLLATFGALKGTPRAL